MAAQPRTLDDVRQDLAQNPIDLDAITSPEVARDVAIKTFRGCYAQVSREYLTGPRDASGVAWKRSDEVTADLPDGSEVTTTVTRIVTDDAGNHLLLLKGKHEVTDPDDTKRKIALQVAPTEARRPNATKNDPVYQLVAKLASVLSNPLPAVDPTAPAADVTETDDATTRPAEDATAPVTTQEKTEQDDAGISSDIMEIMSQFNENLGFSS